MRRRFLKKKRTALMLITAMVLLSLIIVWYTNNVSVSFASSFTSDQCSRACWMGIEPGVTTLSEVSDILRSKQIDFEFVDGPWDEENGIYNIRRGESGEEILGLMTFHNGRVGQITLGSPLISVCVSTLLEEYGIPEDLSLSNGYYYLSYIDKGIVFSVNGNDDVTKASAAFLPSEQGIQNFKSTNPLDWTAIKDTFAGDCNDDYS